MAVVKYTAIVTELFGKLSGSVFQRCGNSPSLRSNPSKKNNQSVINMKSKLQFNGLTGAWRNISTAQKNAWFSGSLNYQVFDRFGNRVRLNGYQAFIYINRPLAMCGYSLVLNCPSPTYPGPGNIVFLAISVTTATLQTSTLTTIPSGYSYIVYIKRNIPSGGNATSIKKTFGLFLPAGWVQAANSYSRLTPNLRYPLVVGEIIELHSYYFDTTLGFKFLGNINRLVVS